MPNKSERIGKLRERITLQVVTETQSSSGHAAQSWATLATVWAAIDYRASGSDEREMAGRKVAEQMVRFTIRYRADVTEKTRISYNSQVYDITFVGVTPDKFFLELEAQKRN